jgi:cytochrome c oxidase subunit 2
MPITVEVKSEADYARWVEDSKGKWGTKPLTAMPAPAPVSDDPDKKFTMAEAKAAGEKIFGANCAACHQLNGKGLPPAFPPLSGSKVVQGPAEAQLVVLLNGRAGTAMQSFARLADSDLAAVITYTRNSWANNTGKVVQPSDVRAARKS